MSNEIVRYSNAFNQLALTGFDAVHLDALMAIASKVRDQGASEVVLTYGELRQLMRTRSNLTVADLTKAIVAVNARLLRLTGQFMDGHRIVQLSLFNAFITDPEAQTLTVRVNGEYLYLFNDLTSEFTRFELKEFASLKSRYAKEAYRRLKQYRRTGLWIVDRDELCRLLDVPPKVAANTANLNRSVIKPIADELGPLIGLKINRKYRHEPGAAGRGRLSGFIFTFQSDPQMVRVDAPKPKRKASPRPHWTTVQPFGKVWTTTPLFDIETARAHFAGDVPQEQCPYCQLDAKRNGKTHGIQPTAIQ